MSEFSGMVAIVTGSSSGIGERTAQRLAELGAHVVVNSASSVEAGEKLAVSLPNGAIYIYTLTSVIRLSAKTSSMAPSQRLAS